MSREVVVLNDAGMHLRPAANFVQVANKYKNCEVRVFKGNPATDTHVEGPVNGKSIMGLIMLTAQKGTKLLIECKGENAQEALDELCQLVNNRFGMDT
ncbi:MAG: HPr family phosphocarrier protein [Candidatus Sumerlaeaceae bacterium]|nr:HPr family phosphocarrier protein [Candidatus Sumerlaeaceae bacterium]